MTVRRILPIFLMAIACHSDQTAPEVHSIGEGCTGAVVVKPSSVTLHVAASYELLASAIPGCFPPSVFRWNAADTLIATVDSVSGMVVARKPGQTTIIASALPDRIVKAASAVTVVP